MIEIERQQYNYGSVEVSFFKRNDTFDGCWFIIDNGRRKNLKTKKFQKAVIEAKSKLGIDGIIAPVSNDKKIKKLKQQGRDISKEQYDTILVEQDNRCPGCNKLFSDEYDKCVDHCHETNKTRGILCRRCNLALGHAKDNPAILINLVTYLAKYGIAVSVN